MRDVVVRTRASMRSTGDHGGEDANAGKARVQWWKWRGGQRGEVMVALG
jgi:hypothetical protein